MKHGSSLDSRVLSATEPPPLVLRLLGVPEVHFQGRPLHLTRSQTRAVLFRLGTRLQPVARDELSALFWPEIRNSEARQNLRRLLSFVRSDLPQPDSIVATTDSVALDPKLVWSDADSLLHSAGNNSIAGWETVASLYSGQFLSGFSLRKNADFERWQAETTEQLRSASLAALAKLMKYCSGNGDYASAVQHARHYLAIDNVAESVHKELIVLYAQLGERDLALRQFEECVRILEKELGVDPLPETRAAYNLALHNGIAPVPVNTLPSRYRSPTPPLDVPLVGRESAQKDIAAAYLRLRPGGYIFITGELGIGKSRVLHAFAAQQDAVTVVGRCHQGTRPLAYHPIMEALRHALLTAGVADCINPVWLAEIAQFMPEIRLIYPRLSTGAATPEKRQARQCEAVFQALNEIAARKQLIFCLEDLQWADEETLAWLRYAARRLRGTHICVMATCVEGHSAGLDDLKSYLEGLKLTAEIRLQGLDIQAAAEIVRTVNPTLVQDESLVRLLLEATGGNTLFLLEYVRELVLNSQVESQPNTLAIPDSVEKVVALRVARLSPLGRQILETAAVLNPHLDVELVLATAAHYPHGSQQWPRRTCRPAAAVQDRARVALSAQRRSEGGL